MKGKPAGAKKVGGMKVTGKTTRKKRKKPSTLKEHTRSLKSALKW